MLFFTLLLAVFAWTVSAKNPDYIDPRVRMTTFSYAYYCTDEDNLCGSIRENFNNAFNAINKIVVVEPSIYFEAYIDKVSKYRSNTTEITYAATVNTTTFEALKIDKATENFDFQNNIISPYPNPSVFKNHGNTRFYLLLNNFLEEGLDYAQLKYDFENIYKKVIVKTLATFKIKYLNKNRPPPPNKPTDDTNGFVEPPPEGFPIPPGGKLDDVVSILENRLDEMSLTRKFNETDKTCEDEKKNELYKVFNWKDYLIGKNNKKLTTKKNYKRVIAVGDIHGDYQKLVNVLRHASLIDENNNWIAKNTALVQTGDLMDRGSEIKKILDLLLSLKEQAKKKKSEVILNFGNHEIMNFRGSYGFVSLADVESFGGLSQREQDFSPTGKYGKVLRKEMRLATILNDSIFLHAGLLPEYIDADIDTINSRVQKILMNAPSFDELYEAGKRGEKPELYSNKYLSDDGPLFNRDLIRMGEGELCAKIEETLKLTKTKRMIVGHNPQDYGEIRTRCGVKVIFIDLGMSYCYGNYFGYLEMNNNNEIWARYNN